MSESLTMTESDILDEIVGAGEPGFSPDVARSILELKFSDRAVQRMRDLLDRNNQGVLSTEEQTELERYRRVALLMDLLQGKARVSLTRAG